MNKLLEFLQKELGRVIEERVRAHVSSCKNPQKCNFVSNDGTKPGWLAQGSYNIVFCDLQEREKVYRFGFFTYDNEKRAKERVAWNEAMQQAGIGACTYTTYTTLSEEEKTMRKFIRELQTSFHNIIKQTGSFRLTQCFEKLDKEKERIIEKASRALEMWSEQVGHSIYLFYEVSSYAPEGDLRAFLVAENRSTQERVAAWKAAYVTVQNYTKLFERRLRSRGLRRCDAVLVDLKPSNFLVYKDPSDNGLSVVFGDAGLYELSVNASASELSLRSLQLLSGLYGKENKSLCTQLSLGVFATLLANSNKEIASTSEEVFAEGIQVLQDEQDQDLLKQAIALTANLRFPKESPYLSFLEVIAHYVLRGKTNTQPWVHSHISGADSPDFQTLHDYSLTPGAAEMTAAAEQYTALLYKVFACRACGKPTGSTKKSIEELLTDLKTPYDKHAVPRWLQRQPFASSALLHYKKVKPKQGSFPYNGNWPAYPLVFYDDGKESKRINIVTFFFIPAGDYSGCCRTYLAWNEFLCSYKIGASETRSVCEITPPAPTSNGSSNKRWFLFCHTQPDDEGVLAETKVQEIAAKAWVQLFWLMQRYARTLLQWSQSKAKQASRVPVFYFGTWDPRYVAVYSYMLGGKLVVRVRLLEALQLVELQRGLLTSVPRTTFAPRLPTQGPSELAVIFYLSLLANGASHGQNCFSTKAVWTMALSPLLKAIRRTGVDWQKTLGAAPQVSLELGLATAGAGGCCPKSKRRQKDRA